MKRILWQLRLKIRALVRNVIRRVRSVFFPISVSSLKQAEYQKLPAPIAWEKIAQNRDLHVEIGSGHGEVLLANNKEKSIIVGYEIKSRFFRLSQRKTRKRQDIFIYKGNGYESTLSHYKNASISTIFILFPDPWHKAKHNKRRPLIAEYFLAVAQKLKNDGRIVIATDWPDYAEFIKNEVAKITEVYEVAVRPYNPEEFDLPITHYHQKWVRKGRSFTAFVLQKR